MPMVACTCRNLALPVLIHSALGYNGRSAMVGALAKEVAMTQVAVLRAEVIRDCLDQARGSLLGVLGSLSNAMEYLEDEEATGIADHTQDSLGVARMLMDALTRELTSWQGYAVARGRQYQEQLAP